MKRFIRVLALPSILILAIFSWSGCIQLEQEIWFKDANSGKFRTRLAIPLAIYRSLTRDEKDLMTDPLLGIFNPQIGSLLYSELNGVKLTQYRTYEKGGSLNVLIEGEITDFQLVSKSQILGKFQVIENKQGTYTFEVEPSSSIQLEPKSLEENPSETGKKQKFRKLLDALKISLKVEVPEKIIASSASNVEGRIAQWIFDPDRDDTFLSVHPEIRIEFE